MKIFVTGATGFVGRYLVESLIQKGHEILCLVRNRRKADEILGKNVQLIEGDIKHEESYRDVLLHVDLVFHLAGDVFNENPTALFETNTNSTEKLFLGLKESVVRRFIFLSSMAAVGPVNMGERISEDTMPHPISPYGKSKLEAEKILKSLASHSKREVCVVRAPLIYGIGMSTESRLALFVKRLSEGTFGLIGDGENVVGLCRIKTIVNFLTSVVDFPKMTYEIFHVADPSNKSLRHLAALIANHLGISMPKRRIPRRLAFAIGRCFDMIHKIVPINFYLTSERVRELTGNWDIDLTKASRLGFNPDSNWEEEFLSVVTWLSNQMRSK